MVEEAPDLQPLTQDIIEDNLVELPAWNYADDQLSKEFDFSSFLEVVNFINKLAPFFEQVEHHPDIHIYYNKVVFELQTHDAGDKVTQRDFIVANEIEQRYDER